LRVVDELSGDWSVLDSLFYALDRDVFYFGFVSGLRHVFDLVLNLVVIGDYLFNGHVFNLLDFLVFGPDSLVGDVLDSGLALD